MKLTLSAKRLTERRQGLGRERTPEELILGHRRADPRPKPQMDILVGTVSQRGLQVPHTQDSRRVIHMVQVYCCDSPGNTKHNTLITYPSKWPDLGRGGTCT